MASRTEGQKAESEAPIEYRPVDVEEDSTPVFGQPEWPAGVSMSVRWSTVVPLALFGGFFAASCYSLRHTDPKRLLRRRTVSGIGCGLGYLWTSVAVDLYQTSERTEEPAYDDHPERPLWEAAEFISDNYYAQKRLHARWACLKSETRPADWSRFLEITAIREHNFLQRDGINRWTRMGDRIRLASSSIETRTLCALDMWRFNWAGEGWYVNDTDYTRAVIYMGTLANWDRNSDLQTKTDITMLASALVSFYTRNRHLARVSGVTGLCTVAANVLSTIQFRQYLHEPSTFCDPYGIGYVVRCYLRSVF